VGELVVGIFMIERYDAFVGIKDVPAEGNNNGLNSGTLRGAEGVDLPLVPLYTWL
jgi:hypothetical protein